MKFVKSWSDVLFPFITTFLDSRLLDDIDCNIIEEQCLSVPNEDLPHYLKVALILTPIFLASPYLWSNPQFLILAILVFPVVLDSFTSYLSKKIALYYVRAMKGYDSSVSKAFGSLRLREIASFSLQRHIDSSTHEFCLKKIRIVILQNLRDAVQHFRSKSEALTCASERQHLLINFITDDMESLISIDGEIQDEFLKISSLKTLWQFMFLLRSEYVRLSLLKMFGLSGPKFLFYLLYMIIELNEYSRNTARISSLFTIVDRHSDECSPERTPISVINSQSMFDQVRVYLDIAYDMLLQSDSEQKASDISNILSAAVNILNSRNNVSSTSNDAKSFTKHTEPRSHASHDIASEELSADIPLGDQVFEAKPMSPLPVEEQQMQNFEEEFPPKNSLSIGLITELNTTLKQRKENVKQREKVALARFYNIPVDEVQDDEDENENAPNENKIETENVLVSDDGTVWSRDSTENVGVENPKEFNNQRALWATDLGAALKIRSNLCQETTYAEDDE
ncbi:hypothetical protein AB6A40_003084 [Gnathostoma spinigerum]|uniref:Vezatin n=1 Tax=Gnathostoma spinigerum TaxID=75299 RepID=A0ABD6E9P4_9BILA